MLLLLFRYRWFLLLMLSTSVPMAAFSGPAVQAEDFRVETRIFSDGSDQPVSETLTLFAGGVVYDFPSDDARVTIYAPQDNRIVLLDRKRRVRCEMSEDLLLDFSARVRDWAAEHDSQLMRFAAEPRFELKSEPDTGWLRFASRWIRYDVETRPALSVDVANQYRRSSDAFAHLNTLTNPGGLPPFARLAVNRALAEDAAVPAEIRLHIPPQPQFGNQSVDLRSHHHFRGALDGSDQARLEEAARANASFRDVKLREFLKSEE
ncbi:MAG: hypothetical protein DWQ31_01030 [Planctomycetota bacterium]|nr:MAG: hypothetical protein DWQ31_01030 [Planctomycetota bacterium]